MAECGCKVVYDQSKMHVGYGRPEVEHCPRHSEKHVAELQSQNRELEERLVLCKQRLFPLFHHGGESFECAKLLDLINRCLLSYEYGDKARESVLKMSGDAQTIIEQQDNKIDGLESALQAKEREVGDIRERAKSELAKINPRRLELIRQRTLGTLSYSELDELSGLQDCACAITNIIAPRPDVKADLKEKADNPATSNNQKEQSR